VFAGLSDVRQCARLDRCGGEHTAHHGANHTGARDVLAGQEQTRNRRPGPQTVRQKTPPAGLKTVHGALTGARERNRGNRKYVIGAAEEGVSAPVGPLSRCKTRMIRKRRHGTGAVVKQQEEGRVGAWRSLVAHLHGVQGVPSSNLGAPTSFSSDLTECLWSPLWSLSPGEANHAYHIDRGCPAQGPRNCRARAAAEGPPDAAAFR
jgi:hypothetical protein